MARRPNTLTHPTFGTLTVDEEWSSSVEVGGQEVEVSLTLEKVDPTVPSRLDALARFVTDLPAVDSLAREAIRARDAGAPDGAARLYRTHHLEELDGAELKRLFGKARSGVTAAAFWKKLALQAVRLDARGRVLELSMES